MATGDWRGARDAFSAVLAVAEVPEASFGLANALFWLGDLAGTIANCEKAYAGFRRRGDPMFAAGAALSLVGYNKGYLGNTAAARGWLSRAARIIENEAPELRGELLGATAYVTEDPVESEALARQAAEIGRANGHTDLELMAMHAVGQALVQQGRTEEGMALLDEAMAGVIGGEYGDPLTAAQMSCMTMVVCGSCFDLERATQWVQSLQGFIERYGCPFLYAECRTYYGRVLFENGDWAAAEALLADAIAMSKGVFAAPHAFAAGTLAEHPRRKQHDEHRRQVRDRGGLGQRQVTQRAEKAERRDHEHQRAHELHLEMLRAPEVRAEAMACVRRHRGHLSGVARPHDDQRRVVAQEQELRRRVERGEAEPRAEEQRQGPAQRMVGQATSSRRTNGRMPPCW